MKRIKILLLVVVSILCFLVSCKKDNVQVVTSSKNESISEVKSETSEKTDFTEDDIKIKKEIEALQILNVSGYRDTDTSAYIEIEFSNEIADGFDANAYIKVEPLVNYAISKVSNKLILRGGFDVSKSYKITILNGVKAIDGGETTKEENYDVMFSLQKPKIMFSNDGIILPSVNEKKVFVRSLNVTKFNIIVRKVYVNNTTQFLHKFNFNGNGQFTGYIDDPDESGSSGYDFDNIGDLLYNEKYDVENETDTWVQTAIDLSSVLDSNGIYMIDVKFDKEGTSYKFQEGEDQYYYMYRNAKISKTIFLTDIGIMAQKTLDGYHVNVFDILDNNPLRGVKTYLMSRNNQILEEKTTDADGVVDFTNCKNCFYILAEDNRTRSILVLQNALNTNGFSVDGKFVSGGIDGYIYTERGVYRPGDTVYVSIIARSNGKALEVKQPIKMTVYDPTGVKVIDNDVVNNAINGFYTYKFKTDISARTGIWKLEAAIGDEIIRKDISIEAVVPNKIKVNLNIPEVVDYNKGIDGWTINSNYLFGEPAADLNYDVSFTIREDPIDFPKYKDYAFTIPTSYGYTGWKSVDGTLNAVGYGDIKPDFEDLKFGSVNLIADAVGHVVEDGGRNVIAKKFIELRKYDTYIGIENVNTYRQTGSKLNLKVICVTSDGETLVPNKKLKYRIYANDHYWWWDYTNYSAFIRSFKSDKNTILMKEGEVITKDVPILLDDVLPDAEYLYVEIENEETGQVAGVNLQSSEWVDPSVTKKIETLNVTLDKKTYGVGDTAQIMFNATKSSKAIITIEKAGKIVDQYYKDINDTNAVEKLSITKDMAPNVYVYVTLLQDYNTKQNDRPLRLYGVTPLFVEDEDTKIDLEIEAPEQIRPNEKFVVKVKNNKHKKVNFTVAVVDEGLLDITAFKTPNPWDYFFQKLASQLTFYDNYSEIIDRPYGAINQILKIGGDESLLDEMARRKRLKDLGLEDADRFKPVSMFKGVFTTDDNGEATVDFEMPSYMGSVRIMAVACNDDSYGSAEKNMIVKAPLIISPTLPRSMKIGDKLTIPVSVFALEDGVGDVEIYYTFRGKTQTKTLQMKKGDKQIVYFDEEVEKIVSNEKITIGAHSNIYNYEETCGIAVNSNSTPIAMSEEKVLTGREEATFTQDIQYVPGTLDSMITISNTKMLGLDKRLKYLIKYPYGCVEQTTSSIFPQLFIDKLSTTVKYNKAEIVDNINSGIERLRLFQLNNGGFSYWPGDKYVSSWASNYVGHFLIYAKKNGYHIFDSMYNNWLKYTTNSIRVMRLKYDDDIKYACYSLYLLALAGKPSISDMNYMFENYMDRLDEPSKMYLAAAYKLSGENQVALSIASKVNMTSIKKDYEYRNNLNKHYYDYSYGSLIREMAVYLDCYTTIYEKNDEEVFNEILIALRNENWYSTQTISYALIALSNNVDNSIKEAVKGVIDVDGVKTEYNTENQYMMLANEAKSIKVIPDTNAKTYVYYYSDGVPINSVVENYSDGFSINRYYYNEKGTSIDATNVKSGDTFWLKVEVKPTTTVTDKIKNIALMQVLPSGWEIENLRVSNTNAPEWMKDSINGTNVSYTDIRDDRIMWFFDSTNQKSYNFFVKINAVTKGEYDLPGTTLEAMYDNNYKAYLKGMKVKVE